jgi:hypothetical protein
LYRNIYLGLAIFKDLIFWSCYFMDGKLPEGKTGGATSATSIALEWLITLRRSPKDNATFAFVCG